MEKFTEWKCPKKTWKKASKSGVQDFREESIATKRRAKPIKSRIFVTFKAKNNDN